MGNHELLSKKWGVKKVPILRIINYITSSRAPLFAKSHLVGCIEYSKTNLGKISDNIMYKNAKILQ